MELFEPGPAAEVTVSGGAGHMSPAAGLAAAASIRGEWGPSISLRGRALAMAPRYRGDLVWTLGGSGEAEVGWPIRLSPRLEIAPWSAAELGFYQSERAMVEGVFSGGVSVHGTSGGDMDAWALRLGWGASLPFSSYRWTSPEAQATVLLANGMILIADVALVDISLSIGLRWPRPTPKPPAQAPPVEFAPPTW